MPPQKPSSNEEEFILKAEAQQRHLAAVARSQAMKTEERERRRRDHYMKCPKCGMDLETVKYREVPIDKCYSCNGMWLDEGELEQLARKGSDVLSRIASIFRSEPEAGGKP